MSPRLFLVLALAACAARAEEWPRFLGPRGDGTSFASEWNKDWSKKQPKKLWETEVGTGCSSIAIANGRAVTVGQVEAGKDTVFCFDPVTGAKMWAFSYEQKLDPAYYSGGPSATPAIDSGRVYVLGKDGALFCINLPNGKVLWHKNLVSDFGGVKQTWGFAASPLTVNDLLILEPGGKGSSLVALKKDGGMLVWQAGDDPAAYATPVLFKTPTVTGLACFNQNGLVGRDLSGHELFRHQWRTQYDVNAAAPLFHDGGVFVSSSYGAGCALVRVFPGPPQEVWKNKTLQLQFQNAVFADGFIFAVSGDNSARAMLKCLEFATGKLRWEEPLRENRGSIISAGGMLLVLSESGELILLHPNPGRFEEAGRVQVNKKPCWAPPAFANGLFYTRNNEGRLTCFDLR
jgi:outer membrane protein assembly factor BamB